MLRSSLGALAVAAMFSVAACGAQQRTGDDAGGHYSLDAEVAPDGGFGTPDATNQTADAGTQSAERSGTRLRRRFVEGLPHHAVFDSQRLEECGFTTAADGKLRCLPSGSGYAYSGVGGIYADANCQQLPLYPGSAGCTPPSTVRLGVEGSCAGPRYFALGSTFAGAAYQRTRDGCEPLTGDQRPLYRLGSEIPASAFVAASVERLGNGRIRLETLSGEDGSQLRGAPFDTEAEHPCFVKVSQGATTCTPSGVTATVSYQDPGCVNPVATVSGQLCEGKLAGDYSNCDWRFYKLASSQGATSVYGMDATGKCSQTASSSPATYSLGAPVALASLSAITIIGTGSIRRQAVSVPGGIQIGGQYWDPVHDLPCSLSRSGDLVRCIASNSASVQSVYRDPACTQPALIAYGNGCSTPDRGLLSDGTACTDGPGAQTAPNHRQFKLGSRIDSPSFYVKLGACTLLPLATYSVYPVLEEETDLPTATLQTE